MKTTRKQVRIAADSLPRWTDGKAKQSIVDFVAKVTKESSPDFAAVDERISTFNKTARFGPTDLPCLGHQIGPWRR